MQRGAREKKKNQSPAGNRSIHLTQVGEWVLFTVFFLVLWLVVRPELHYQNADAGVFLPPPEWPFWFSRPGAALERMTAWGLQICQIPWLGALLGTALTWLGCAFLKRLAGGSAAEGTRFLHWLMVPPFFMLLSQYQQALVAMALAWTLAVGLAAAACALARRWPVWTWLAPWAGTLLTYGVAGAGAVLFFLTAAVAGQWAPRRPPRPAWLLELVLAAVAVMVINITLAKVPWERTFGAWASPQMQIIVALLAGTPLLLILGANFLAGGAAAANPTPHPHASPGADLRHSLAAIVWAAGLAAATAVAAYTFPAAKKQHLQMAYHAARGQWEAFLKLAREQNTFSPGNRLNLLLALYHTGQLPDNLFAFAVTKEDELLPNITHGPEAFPALSRAMLELGQVNHAERFACEAVEILGERPELLTILAHVHQLKGYPLAAGNFLRALEKQPFQGRRARKLLEQLAADPQGENDAELTALRRVMVKTDYTSPGSPTAPLMQQLLHSNPTNRMAFEFLLMHYLISGQLDRFAEQAGRLPAFAYPAPPRHFQEALLLVAYLKKIPLPEGPAFQINQTTRQRYARFNEQVRAHITDLDPLRPLLAREFGDTYWYFFLFGQTASCPTNPSAKPL